MEDDNEQETCPSVEFFCQELAEVDLGENIIYMSPEHLGLFLRTIQLQDEFDERIKRPPCPEEKEALGLIVEELRLLVLHQETKLKEPKTWMRQKYPHEIKSEPENYQWYRILKPGEAIIRNLPAHQASTASSRKHQ